jgi:SAM-dependent methyltransferase
MVSEDYIISLYRVLLDREPENNDVVRWHTNAPNREVLLRRFLTAKEFLARRLIPLHIGRHLEPDVLPVDVSASPEQLGKMLAGIAEKWREFGKTEPHWSVLVGEEFRSSNISKNLEKFYASGEKNIDIALRAVMRAGIDPAGFKTAVDFGCGVGRLTLALAQKVDFVTGVDISDGHVHLAQERAHDTQVNNVAFKVISDVSDIATIPKTDFIISIIVLQHNPPPIIAVIFRMLLKLLHERGVAYIQVPTFIDNYSFDVECYLDRRKVNMEMNCLPQRSVFQIIHDEGCIPLEVREDGWTGEAGMISKTFLIQKM